MTPAEQNAAIQADFSNDDNLPQESVLKQALESIMERVQDTYKGRITCDLMLVWRSIADGVIAQTASTR